MASQRKPKTIDLHIIVDAELEGSVIKSIQKEEVVTLPYRRTCIIDYLDTHYPFQLMELLEHPTDRYNAYYHRISVLEAMEKGYSVQWRPG